MRINHMMLVWWMSRGIVNEGGIIYDPGYDVLSDGEDEYFNILNMR